MNSNIRFYKAAGITFQVTSQYPISDITFHPKFRHFETDRPGQDLVKINHFLNQPPPDNKICLDKTKVYAKDQWQIFKSDMGWILEYTTLFPDAFVKKAVAVINHDFSLIDVYVENLSKENYSHGGFPALTLFNTDQMVFAKLLNDRDGLMIHSNGFIINGNGLIFAGVSGAGKSTLSRMLKAKGYEILCDDRMMLRQENGKFNIYGNWCYGSHPDVSASWAPLKKFCFLEKARKNAITEIEDQKDIASSLLKVVVKPLLDKEGWKKHFKVIGALQKNVRFYRVAFDLSGSIADILAGQ